MANMIEPEYLIGATELAELLIVDHSTITAWARRNADFPKPIVLLRSCRAWDLREVLEWCVEHDRVRPYEVSRLTKRYMVMVSERMEP